jgi:SAM-dependent methyltransferase
MQSFFPDHFSSHPDRYAAARPQYPAALFDWIAANAPATERVWDCGTGNGQAAVGLAHVFAAVEASDPSSEQIANALPAANVHYSVQPAESTTFPDAHFDAVCVAQALHWFDFARFFPEVRRVLRTNGLFVAWGYTWFTVSPAFDAAFTTHVLEPLADTWAPQNALLWNGYREVSFPFTHRPAPPFQITCTWNLAQLLAYVATWSAVRRYAERTDADLLDAALPVLTTHWGNPGAVHDVMMPLIVWAGTTD